MLPGKEACLKFQSLFLSLILCVAVVSGFAVQARAETTVRGRIIFSGTPPEDVVFPIRNSSPVCGKTKIMQKLLVGEQGGLADVVVVLNPDKRSERKKPGTGIVIQENCEFLPHVQVLAPESMLRIENEDQSIFHNVHGFYDDGSTAFKIAVMTSGFVSQVKLVKEGILTLRSDSGYEWMNAFVFVTYQPYSAVTDENGLFQFDDLPEGKYDVELWHPWLGRHTQELEVGGSDIELDIPWEQ